MKIVRKQLTVDEIQPAGTRYNSTTDTIQTTPDGGTTWNDAPGLDPRHADNFRLPPLSGGSAQCDAAARMAAYVNVQVDNFLNAGSLAQAATGTLGLLLILTGGAGILIDAILIGMDVLITLGTTAIASAFTPTVYEDLKCTFNCHLNSDGQMTADGLAAFQADVFLHYSSTVYTTMQTIGSFTGEVQYSNAGVERTETGDCSGCDCGWCKAWDWTALEDLDGYTVYRGTWAAGDGYDGIFVNLSAQSAAYLYAELGATYHITHLEMTYSGSMDTGTGGQANVQGYLGATQIFSVASTTNGSHITFAWDGDAMVDQIIVEINSGADATTAKIEATKVGGLGTAPSIGQADC